MLEHGKGCWASHNGSPGAVPCSSLISVLNISSHGVHIFISAMPLGLQKSSGEGLAVRAFHLQIQGWSPRSGEML
ncbi:unnamed protein product [Sphagnum jensenii]|uniref:Uncharacterized protein n=1 Tax=Sphagnum jensenii TaxID=128206 RepID=A0ABP1A2F0_9BRYO